MVRFLQMGEETKGRKFNVQSLKLKDLKVDIKMTIVILKNTLPSSAIFGAFSIHPRHKTGAVKINTLGDLKKISSDILEYDQWLQCKTYVHFKNKHDFKTVTAVLVNSSVSREK